MDTENLITTPSSTKNIHSEIFKLKADFEISILKKYIELQISGSANPISSKKAILDLGCGSGEKLLKAIIPLFPLNREKYLIISSDLNTTCFISIRKQTNDCVSPIQHDLNFLCYREKVFDIISMIQAFGEVRDLNLYLKEVYRTLKMNGILIFTFGNRRSYKGLIYTLFGKYKRKFYLFSSVEVVRMLKKHHLPPIEMIGYSFLPFTGTSNSRFVKKLFLLEKWLRKRSSLRGFAPHLMMICKAQKDP